MLLFMALASHSQAQNIKENILVDFVAANAEEPTQSDIEKRDEIESNRRVTQIDCLLSDIGGGHSTSQKFNAALSGANIILLTSTLYVTEDYSGDIKILGELQNASNSDVSFVKITFTFRDTSDNIIDTYRLYIHSWFLKKIGVAITDTILSPGEIGSFKLYTDDHQLSSNEVSILLISFVEIKIAVSALRIRIHANSNLTWGFVHLLFMKGLVISKNLRYTFVLRFQHVGVMASNINLVASEFGDRVGGRRVI
jgi:hypothetical protein